MQTKWERRDNKRAKRGKMQVSNRSIFTIRDATDKRMKRTAQGGK